jgi:hypothetical protein
VAEFSADAWAKLPKAERVVRCQQYACDAEEQAKVQPSFSKQHMEIARCWHELAAEIELER